jgi:SAM-dependent methyltransferase
MAEFEEYNQRYYESRNLHADISRRDARTILLLTRPGLGEKILDLGCGLGHYCNLFASYGASVVGVDISNYAISKAIDTYGMNSKLRFVCKDALKIDYNGEFDKVLCSHVIEHLTPQERGVLLQNIFNALKADGLLVLALPLFESELPRHVFSRLTHGRRGTDPHHRSQFTLDGLQADLSKAGFIIKKTWLLSTLGSYRMPLSLAKLPLLRSILIGAVAVVATKDMQIKSKTG